jgi:SNF2-related domain
MSDVALTADAEIVHVQGPADFLANRKVRLFFETVLTCRRTDDGWACPRRRLPLNDLVVRINSFLEANGWVTVRHGVVDELVTREIERRRSFGRAREAAAAFRSEEPMVNRDSVQHTLDDFGWNSEARPLRDHQVEGVLHALSAVNAANFSVPGSGKTATTLAVAATHLASGTIDLVVVVGPLSSFRPWELETRAAVGIRIRPRRIRGSRAQREDLYGGTRANDLLLLSYAAAAADQEKLIQLCRSFKVMLVVDEAHRIKKFRGGVWTPALVRVARFARVRAVLTGTPMPQDGRDLYSPLNVLWPGGELTGPRDSFAARVDRDFRRLIEDVQPFVSRTGKEALGLPPYEVVYHDVPLTDVQREIYLLIESRLRGVVQLPLDLKARLDALRRARPIRLLQAAANPGLLATPDRLLHLPALPGPGAALLQRIAEFHAAGEVPAKSRRGIELVREVAAQDGKVVCWSNFIGNLDDFARRLREIVGLPVFQVDGRVPAGDETEFDTSESAWRGDDETRERVIERFLLTDGPAALVANPASCSESISLHSACRNAIYLDRTYDCALFLQSIDRIHRLGLPPDARVAIHILQSTVDDRSTVDGLVDVALRRKEATMRQLLEGATLRALHLSEDPAVEAEGDQEDLAGLLRFLVGEDSEAR